MSEVMTPPIIAEDEDGDVTVTFTATHTWADVARWVMTNRTDVEELHAILGSMIAGTYGMDMQ